MNYLHLHDILFNAIYQTESQHAALLKHATEKDVMLEFPCESKEDYTFQTGKPISDEDYNTIIVLNGMYNALYELDCALSQAGYNV